MGSADSLIHGNWRGRIKIQGQVGKRHHVHEQEMCFRGASDLALPKQSFLFVFGCNSA